MRTEDLIRTLAEDTQVGPSPRRSLQLAALGSVAFVAVLFWVTMGPRPDVPELLTGSWRFALKVAFALSLALLAARGVLRLANPVESPRRAALDLLPAVLLLALGVAAEAYSKAGADVMLRLAIGHNGRICLVSIMLLSAAPLAAMLYAMRNGAPASATATGALIGVTSAAFAAAFYALHCTDDSPLFVALWYTIGIAAVTAVGALLGHKLLRW